jgi:phenylalanyl-tRNA synthetase alpha chain
MSDALKNIQNVNGLISEILGGDGPLPSIDASSLVGMSEHQRDQGRLALAEATSAVELEALRVALLGDRSGLHLLKRCLKRLDPGTRKLVGASANQASKLLETAIEEARQRIGAGAGEARPAFDVTLPGRRPFEGRRHILYQVRDEIIDIFRGMGYSVAEGPQVEDDHHNFGALNFGPHHPARDAHDTLFLENGALLRTHTSPVQIRVMETTRPPLRMIFPGRVYRAEQIDPSHAAEFHQIEGLYVDRGVSMAHLKGALFAFARALLGPDTRTRFRPSYFPFTEPSGEVDVSCLLCGGTGQRQADGAASRCSVCKGSGWLEILGCGMVHPNVFRSVGYDPEEWTGFAFGMGFERITMLKYGIPDVRYFLENDLRFLEQF